MIGQIWKSEIREWKDPKTGRLVRQLTSRGNNFHMYFTDNSFNRGENSILFYSDRAAGQDLPLSQAVEFYLFHMDLDTGLITQLMDEPVGGHGTKTPDGRLAVHASGNDVIKLDTHTGEKTVLYREEANFELGMVSISPNLRWAAFCRNETINSPGGANYLGFKERFYRIKDGRVTLAYMDGSGWLDVFRDTHELGHFQFSPDDSTLGTFCHEGPWHLVTQRIWGLDFVSRRVWPIFRQDENDSVGHEFWTQGGLIFFDNRGPGHDGTITSDRTQAVATGVAVKQNLMIPYAGLADRSGEIVRRIEMPYYCNHYHANPDNTLLIGDDVDDLVLIDISGNAPVHQVLSYHGTSWHSGYSHCHPTWDWDGRRILYASDRGGQGNLYLIDLSE